MKLMENIIKKGKIRKYHRSFNKLENEKILEN